MRRARGNEFRDDEEEGPKRRRQRRRLVAAAAAAPAADNRGPVTRQQARAAAEAAAAAPAPARGAPSPAAEEEEDVGSDDSNDRAAAVVRAMGLMPPGAESSEEEAANESSDEDEEDSKEDEDEEELPERDELYYYHGFEEYDRLADGSDASSVEDEDEDAQMGVGGPEYYDDDYDQPYAVLPGGRDWNVVVGVPIGNPARAGGALPQRLPADTQVTAGVWAREQPDGRHILYGEPLRRCPKLLTRIFKMQQQPGKLAWRSELALRGYEWAYLKGVFAHARLQPLLQRGQRVLKPLPDAGFPSRFRPTDSSGQALVGPKIARYGKPWNTGRQYFSSFKRGDPSSFVWADGVGAMEAEAQRDFNQWYGGGMH